LLAAFRAAATSFSCVSKKRKQKKETLYPCPFGLCYAKPKRAACGARSQGAAAELAARFLRFAQTTAASLITMQMRPSAHLRTLRSVRLGTGRRALVAGTPCLLFGFCF